jgi:hypothetical protein
MITPIARVSSYESPRVIVRPVLLRPVADAVLER